MATVENRAAKAKTTPIPYGRICAHIAAENAVYEFFGAERV